MLIKTMSTSYVINPIDEQNYVFHDNFRKLLNLLKYDDFLIKQ